MVDRTLGDQRVRQALRCRIEVTPRLAFDEIGARRALDLCLEIGQDTFGGEVDGCAVRILDSAARVGADTLKCKGLQALKQADGRKQQNSHDQSGNQDERDQPGCRPLENTAHAARGRALI